jgi:hypothetical protein
VEVVQLVRELNPLGGVGGVVSALTRAFDEMGVPNSVLTLDDLLPGRQKADRHYSKLRLSFDVVAYTVLGTVAVRRIRRQKPDSVVINHSDALGGDVFVDHGLHKAMLAQRPWLLLNPLHLFLLARVICLARPGWATDRRMRYRQPQSQGNSCSRTRLVARLLQTYTQTDLYCCPERLDV